MKIEEVEAESQETEAMKRLLAHWVNGVKELHAEGYSGQFCANATRSVIPVLMCQLMTGYTEEQVNVEITVLEAAIKHYRESGWFSGDDDDDDT